MCNCQDLFDTLFPPLLNVDLDAGHQDVLFADDTKLGGAVDSLEGKKS